MPELPEVETTRRGIWPHVRDRNIQRVEIRQRQLRWPVSDEIINLSRQPVVGLDRRGKYLLLQLPQGHIITHLGMSGSLRVIPDKAVPPRKHDHVIWHLDNQVQIRFHDPRRFGCMLWYGGPEVKQHPLLKKLGPEPLHENFDADYLWRQSRGRKVAVKNFVMNSQVVVGVGNIYASEALFTAGIHPMRAAGRVSLARYSLLVDAIKQVLQRSITQGGTTLRDFVGGQGEPGYFRQELNVYERAGQPCYRCNDGNIKMQVIGQRSSYYCPVCQR